MPEESARNANLLGPFIRAQRQTAKLSLRELSAMTEVSNPYLSQIERGLSEPSARVLKSIAQALNISAEALFAQAGLMSESALADDEATESALRMDPRLNGSTQNVYELWPRLRCPVLLVRASRPMAPDGGLVVSQADAERFATEARDATVVNVDADHYSILIAAPAISAVEGFLGAGGT